MRVQLRKEKIIALDKSVDVDERKDEALLRARGVLVNPAKENEAEEF